ncbi:MAG: response regulator transcription factor [Pseudomonadota bacterium]
MNPTRVLLVDDHAVVRMGYKTLMETTGEVEIVAELSSGEEAIRVFGDIKPQVTVMDLSLPGVSGLEAIRRIVTKYPDAKVLAFSMHEDLVFVEQALQAGAIGYISKSSAPTILVDAVKSVADGSIYLDPDIAQRLAFHKARGKTSPMAELSPREFEICSMLASGMQSNEIAEKLSLSAKTIANYTTQLKSKLDVNSIAELTRLAIRHGIVEP